MNDRTRKRDGEDTPEIRRRTIKREPKTSQLLERGEGPTEDEVIDPEVASPSETTVEGGPGTDTAYPQGGPVSPRSRGTGGDGGYSTLGGGVYQDEGADEDVSRGGG
jgi:hypothetical protein